MSIFKYNVQNEKGRRAMGNIVAASKNDAIAKLQAKDYKVNKLNDITDSFEGKLLRVIAPVKTKDLVIFTRQFSVMVSSNVPVVESLMILVDQTKNITLKNIISEIAYEVDSGDFLSDAMTRRPKVFSDFFVNIVKSGETSGKLDEVLDYLADEMEKAYDTSSKIKTAMIYPVFIMVGLFAVGIVLMVYVIPNITEILSQTGAELPLSTRIVIAVSDFLQKYAIGIVVFLVLAFFGIRAYSRTYGGKLFFDTLKLKIPIFGKLFKYIYIMRFSRSLSTLLKGGVTITKSLEIVANVIGNTIYKELILETLKSINDGNSFSEVFEKSEYMPKMVPQMINVGERTGKIDMVLDKINDFYTRESDNMLNNLGKLMEPLIMVIMGIGVGIMVAAVLLPMYNLAGQF